MVSIFRLLGFASAQGGSSELHMAAEALVAHFVGQNTLASSLRPQQAVPAGPYTVPLTTLAAVASGRTCVSSALALSVDNTLPIIIIADHTELAKDST